MGLMTQNKWIQIFTCAILVFSPPMLWRVNQHTALVAHFMILAALYLSFCPRRTSKIWNTGFLWGLLLSAAVLTHFSLFVMLAAIWAANLADQIVFTKVDRFTQIKNSFLQVILIGSLITFLMWQAGYFTVSSTSGSLGGYGFFRMNLLSPFDPKGWSYLLRTLPLPTDYGEGYMYFGLGLLILWPFGIYQFIRNADLRRVCKQALKQHIFLVIALLLMALFAITNHIAIGRKELVFEISGAVYAAASIFRASGRFFWPMFYALNLTCLFLVIRGYKKQIAIVLIGLACVLQIADSSAGWWAMHKQIADPAKNVPHELNLKNAFWGAAAKRYEEVLLVPPQDKAWGWDQIALYAAKHHLGTNAVFFARADAGKLAKAQDEFMNGLYNSTWKDNSLYILQPDLVIPAYFHSNPNTDLLAAFDGFAALAPNWKNCKDCPPIQENLREELNQLTKQVTLNQSIGFGKGQLGTRFLIGMGGSWAWPESWGVWSNGDQTKIILPVPQSIKVGASPKQIKLDVRAFVSTLHPKQDVEVFIDQMPPQSISLFDPNSNAWVINLPANMATRKYLELQFRFKNPASPKDVGGVPGDDRRLGMGLISATYY
jgi:hypothetical protein